jgi:RimJ/RimL family protein N-acetyltransferase
MAEGARSAPPGYPDELERTISLPDGAALRLRPIRPEDAPRLIEYYGRLTAHTAYQRFFTVMKRLPPDWARFLAVVDYRRRLALVAERGPREAPELIGVARYEPTETEEMAEVAFVVRDDWQGRGLGRLLVQLLLDAGAARGIRRFRAYVLAENARMLTLLRHLTDVQESRTESGVVQLIFTARPGPAVAHG